MIGKKYFFYLVFFVFILFNSVLFAEEDIIENSETKICILAYDTEFKKNLTEALVQDFNSKGISVIVDTISNESQYSAADYNVIILLSGAFMGNPRSKAVRFIKTNNYSSNIIYVFTTRKNSPYGTVLDKDKIDAITSASITDDNKILFDKVKNKIIEKVMKVLSK